METEIETEIETEEEPVKTEEKPVKTKTREDRLAECRKCVHRLCGLQEGILYMS